MQSNQHPPHPFPQMPESPPEDARGRVASHIFRQSPGREDGGTPATHAASAPFSRLIRPTWAEVDEARERYVKHANRLRFWKWWFVGMATLYTALVGILLFQLFTGP